MGRAHWLAVNSVGKVSGLAHVEEVTVITLLDNCGSSLELLHLHELDEVLNLVRCEVGEHKVGL